MQKYYTIVTDLGTELLAKAAQRGEKVNVVSIAAGDGDGSLYTPTSDMTALKREIWRGAISNYEIDSVAKNVIKISGVIPKEIGQFVLREIAIFDDNNNMIAICNSPDLLKAVLEEGALTEAAVCMMMAVTNTDVVNIVVNSSAIYATARDLDAHKNDENAHEKLFDKKVDKTEFTAELAKKVDEIKFTTELAKKVDETDFTTELAKKVDETDFTTELGKKVDKTEFTTELNKKVDKTEFTTELNKKVDKTEFTTELNKKVDKTTLTTELNKKVDKTDFTGEKIGEMLEEEGWQSGTSLTKAEIYNILKPSGGGSENISFGVNALAQSVSGSMNTAVGNQALYNNTNGRQNTAVGFVALKANTAGYSNTAVGEEALYNNTQGNQNTAVGLFALGNSKTGNCNTALGEYALSYNTTGSSNTAVGCQALKTNTNYSNCTGLGANSAVTASNQVQLGDTNVTVYAQTAIQTRSDQRDKVEIQDTVLGLDFIKKLTPRQFKMNSRELYFEQDKKRDFTAKNDGSKAGKRFHQGFVAQEVKKVLDEMGIDFAGYQDHKINGGEDVLSLGYTEFIAPMVKAMQQQQQMIELQQQEIEALKQKVNGEVS